MVLPLSLRIVFGVVDFSVAMNDWNSVRQGSREGARQGSVYTTGGSSSCSLTAPNTVTHEIVCLTKDRTQLIRNDSRVKVTFSDANGDSVITNADFIQGDGSIIVCVQYPVRSVSGFFTEILNNQSVSSKVEMRLDDVNDGGAGEDPIELYQETAHTTWGFCS